MDVLRFRYDTFVPEVVAPDFFDPLSLSGGHWVGARNYDERASGELWLRTASGAELHVDDDVYAWLNSINLAPSTAWPRTHTARLVDRWIYLVHDDAGERRGCGEGSGWPRSSSRDRATARQTAAWQIGDIPSSRLTLSPTATGLVAKLVGAGRRRR